MKLIYILVPTAGPNAVYAPGQIYAVANDAEAQGLLDAQSARLPTDAEVAKYKKEKRILKNGDKPDPEDTDDSDFEDKNEKALASADLPDDELIAPLPGRGNKKPETPVVPPTAPKK